jgi:peptidoglycan/LPS O-acetylase OafA/YrhL
MPDENLETMLSYLRENSGRYSLEALRGQLLAAGHSPEAADQAIAELRAQSPPPEPSSWRLALLVAVVDLALLGVVVAMVLSMPGIPDDLLTAALLGLPALYFAQFVAGAVMLSLPARRRLGKGLLLGGLLFVGVGILAVGGFCLFIFSLDL